MLFSRSSSLLAVTALTLTAAASGQETVLGGWSPANVTESEVALLVQAAGNASYYNDEVTTAICLIAVKRLETQSVAGTNYKFMVAGCPISEEAELGACSDRECATSDYDVVIYSQPWSDTLEVSAVTLLE